MEGNDPTGWCRLAHCSVYRGAWVLFVALDDSRGLHSSVHLDYAKPIEIHLLQRQPREKVVKIMTGNENKLVNQNVVPAVFLLVW